ncbi:MAG: antitoxin Xre/MbcA/ParS toxin-binding domain-containing protein [Hyphomonas sp.]
MADLSNYAEPAAMPSSEAARVGRLLGLRSTRTIDEVYLALKVAGGLPVSSADTLSRVVGKHAVIGHIVPEATLRRARSGKKALSREISERLYEYSRVIDAVSRAYHGDTDAILRFLSTPHALLDGNTPDDMARMSSAGAEAVLKLLRRASAGFSV